ncbi:MAG TPA: nucleotidyltransferase domain-containing protein [Xanthobacteraceae bacterium]|nr:nucleotidyltransferase domain-containing protein [Xanthobacteraceae bacterium]
MDETPTSLARALFSQVQLRVLSLLIGQPSRSYQLTDVITLVGSGRGAVQRELRKLTSAGIVEISIHTGRKVYQANKQSPIFRELHGIIVKTAGIAGPLQIALKAFSKKVNLAFVYGSIAKGSDTAKSDIDLMIIGRDVAYGDVYKALQKAERRLRREINPTLMSASEWTKKLSDGNQFVGKMARQPKIFIIGTEHELKRIR